MVRLLALEMVPDSLRAGRVHQAGGLHFGWISIQKCNYIKEQMEMGKED